MPSLVLLAGVPGTGKSTFAKTFFSLKYAIVSSDEIRKRQAGTLRDAHEQQLKPWDAFYQQIETYLDHGVDVIADATFLTPRHRDRAHEIATRLGVPLHLVLFKNWLTASNRNAARDADAQVPEQPMRDMMELYWTTLATIPQEDYATVTKIESFA